VNGPKDERKIVTPICWLALPIGQQEAANSKGPQLDHRPSEQVASGGGS